MQDDDVPKRGQLCKEEGEGRAVRRRLTRAGTITATSRRTSGPEKHTLSRKVMITPTEARQYHALVVTISERWGRVSYSQVSRALWQVLYRMRYALARVRSGVVREAPFPTRVEEMAAHEHSLTLFLEVLFADQDACEDEAA